MSNIGCYNIKRVRRDFYTIHAPSWLAKRGRIVATATKMTDAERIKAELSKADIRASHESYVGRWKS